VFCVDRPEKYVAFFIIMSKRSKFISALKEAAIKAGQRRVAFRDGGRAA
jgi:hypothetical protein